MKRKRLDRHLEERLCVIAEARCRPTPADPSGHRYDKLQETYFKLLLAMFPPAYGRFDLATQAHRTATWRQVPKASCVYPIGFNYTIHLMDEKQRACANELFRQVCAALDKAYRRGLEHGRNLLGQLARGELTVGQFEHRGRRT